MLTSRAGVMVPGILYGTAWKKAETAALVGLAIAQGFRGIDTACQPKHYDEGGVGAGLAPGPDAGPGRADLYLQSKFTSLSGQDPSRVPYDAQAPLPEQVAQSFAASLRNLRTEYLDCLVLHSPLETLAQTELAWRSMEALVDSGGVRQIGLSNCYSLAELEAIDRFARIKPAVLQNRFHAATGYDREIRAFCLEHEIIYQSFWTLTANPRVLSARAITDLASELERTPAQILFRHLTQGGVVPLTGTRSAAHMREDLSIFDFELSPAERGRIDALLTA